MNYRVQKNEQFNSSEIYFDEIPGKATRESLKAIGFRWHSVKKCWYGYKTEEQIAAAIKGDPVSNNEPVNEYGVKVGDVFVLSWGYEQTNLNFFQVIGVTSKKARIVEVNPPRETSANNCMSANHTLTYKEGDMLPRIERPFWISDNEKGDLKAIRDFSRCHTEPQIIIRSRGCYAAYKCHPGQTLYESWYA